MVDVSQYIAAKLAGFEADAYEEAWSRAAHDSELPWEVAAVAPVEIPQGVIEPILKAVETAARASTRQSRPWFGRFAIVGIPAMVAGYVTDTPALSLVAGTVSTLWPM